MFLIRSYSRCLTKPLVKCAKLQSDCYSKYSPVTNDLVKTLQQIVGKENVSISESVRAHHSKDESYHKAVLPDVVVFPRSTQQVSDVTKLCHQLTVPIVPYGTGTGLEAGSVCVENGVCMDVTRMDQVVAVHTEDFDVVVQPGVTRKGLNNYLRDVGLWFPVDPGADASLCGMAATSASGTNAVRYGTMRENVLNLEIVLADGTILHTAGENRRTRKTAAGYNLTNLIVGSEGTLGIITQATLRVHGVPEAMVSAVCHFPTIKDAVDTTVAVLQAGIPVARIEFLDDVQMQACIKYSSLTGFEVLPTLFLEFHGSNQSVEEQATATGEIASSFGGSNFKWAKDQSERNKLWTARHNALYASLSTRPNSRSVLTDVAVPISRLTEIITLTKEDILQSDLFGTFVGHVGDGNFHVVVVIDPDNHDELERAKQFANRVAERAQSFDGTCTGEHGIGIGKKHLLERELGPAGIQMMRNIKSVLDPKCILNPGKVI